jgi:hypothetical protein
MLADSYRTVQESLEATYPDTFEFQGMLPENHKTCSEIYIPIRKQTMIDDLTDSLEEKLNVNILYAVRSRDQKNVKVVIYSMPYKDEMFVISIASSQYGIVNGITIVVFSSLEHMFNYVRRVYQQYAGKSEWETLEAETPQKLFSHFC